VWPLEAAAVVNGIDEDKPLKEGQLIKVAVSQIYKGWGSDLLLALIYRKKRIN
jgi:hypothetical protein